MIQFLRNLNFGYFLLIASPFVVLVGYSNLMNLQAGQIANPTFVDWLKGGAIMFAGAYLAIAGWLKIKKARPKPRR